MEPAHVANYHLAACAVVAVHKQREVPAVLAVVCQRWLPPAPVVPAVMVDAQLLHPVLHTLLELLLIKRHILCAGLQPGCNAGHEVCELSKEGPLVTWSASWPHGCLCHACNERH
jgi:hypothetical protein